MAEAIQELTYEEKLALSVAGFIDDPLGFTHFIFPWDEGDLEGHPGPDDWQADQLEELGEYIRSGSDDPFRAMTASGHGVGKGAQTAFVIIFLMSTRPHLSGVVTANTKAQLDSKTWRELALWHKRSINSHWFTWTATKFYHVDHPETWYVAALPWSKEKPEAFAGLHGQNTVTIYDEASTIPDSIWEVSDGAMTDPGAIWLAYGNLTRPVGRFRECLRRFKHRWRTRQIDSRTCRMTNKEELQRMIDDYGIDSDYCKIRIRGMVPAIGFKQFISSADVDAAFGKHLRPEQFNFAAKVIGVDPAWTGEDEFVIYLRQGLMSKMLGKYEKNDDDIFMAGVIARFEDEYKADAVFVDAGYGTGIVSAGNAMGRSWRIVWFSGKSIDPGCLNKRVEMWNLMKKWLKEGGAIPKDQVLYDDLTGPETVPMLDGKIKLESKEDMRGRGLPSPNRADALALTFAFPVTSFQHEGYRGRHGGRKVERQSEKELREYRPGQSARRNR